MPSLENPAYYERAAFTAPGYADEFFRWADLFESMEAETGESECPLGWVGLVNVTRDMIASYVAFAGDPWMSEARNFAPGWYIVRVDSLGFVFGVSYTDEERARADFAEAQTAYGEWLDRPVFFHP